MRFLPLDGYIEVCHGCHEGDSNDDNGRCTLSLQSVSLPVKCPPLTHLRYVCLHQATATLSTAMGTLSSSETPAALPLPSQSAGVSTAGGRGAVGAAAGAIMRKGLAADNKSRNVPPGECKLRGVTRHRCAAVAGGVA